MVHRQRHARDALAVSDTATALVGTWAVVPLIEAAQLARDRSRVAATRSQADSPPNGTQRAESLADENRDTLVAILCSHAAVEAFTNQQGFTLDRAGWEADELGRKQLVDKWCGLVERLTGIAVPRGHGAAQRIKLLDDERNWIAHYKGFKLADGTRGFAGPPAPTLHLGNISGFRAYYRAAKAVNAVATAWSAIETFYHAISQPLPEYLVNSRR